MKIIKLTESICSYCFKKLDAEITEENNKIYMVKNCPEHGAQKVLIWSDASTYKSWSDDSAYAEKYSGGSEKVKGCPYDCGYCEDHRGSTCTAVIEVTDRCNMGCSVCFASADGKGSDKVVSKIREMIDYVAESQGYCSLQLSGGEPTLRDDLPGIVRYAKETGFKHVQVNTNGIRISEDLQYAQELKDAGTDLIYLGFDSLTDNVYREIRNRDMFEVKKRCIENCRKTGLGVMLVPVIIRNLNDDQVGDIVKFAKENMPVVKGIHFQPASRFGRYDMNATDFSDRYTFPDLLNDLKVQTDGEICPCQILPRKKMSAYCSLSAAYYLDFDNKLVALTKRTESLQDNQYIQNVSVSCCSSGGDTEVSDKLKTAGQDSTNCGEENESKMSNSSAVKSAEKINNTTVSYSCVKMNEKMSIFARNTNNFTEKFWKQNTYTGRKPDNKLSEFNKRVKEYSLSISSMPFQDAFNLDLDRVQGCCVSVIDDSLKTIPLCLYYLTDVSGNRLYKGGECTV